MIPISKYKADQETHNLVAQVLNSGRLSQGPMVEQAEQLIAEISNCKYAVCVANGTIALEAMLRATQLLNGAYIYTSPLTFRATVKAIRHSNMIPMFRDVNKNTLCLEETDDLFYMPVDLYGRKAAMYGDNVFRDAAQGIGLDLSDSRASVISFYTTKNVGAGEGGAVVTNDQDIADRIRLLRNQGMRGQYDYRSDDGFNWRWNELAAAVAIPQLKNLEVASRKRIGNALEYNLAFKMLPVDCPPDGGERNFHCYTLRHSKRDEIVAILRYKGIDARVYYPELVSPKDQWEKTPVALQATKEVFSLPVHHHLTDSEIEYICETVIDVLTKVTNV